MLVTSTPPYFSTTRGDESRQILRFQRQMHGLERIKVYTLRPDLSRYASRSLGVSMERASMETRARVGNIAWLWTINSKEDEREGPIRKENAREIPTLSRFSGFDPIPSVQPSYECLSRFSSRVS